MRQPQCFVHPDGLFLELAGVTSLYSAVTIPLPLPLSVSDGFDF